MIKAQNDSVSSVNEPKFLTGLLYNQPFAIETIDSTEIKNIARKSIALSEVLDKVLQDHPAITENLFNEKTAEMSLKTAKGNLLPAVSLTADLFSNYNLSNRYNNGSHVPLNKQLDNNFGKTTGILVQIPLFSNYQNRTAIEKGKIAVDNAKMATKETANEIAKNTQQLVNDFIAAQQVFLLQDEALQQSRLSYTVFEERHKLGYISSLELILAKDQLYAQQAKAAEARYDLYFRYKLIELLINL